MNAFHVVGALVAVALLAYLTLALLRPELFQ
jgi:K+-transporting ATPase KdpF subunit